MTTAISMDFKVVTPHADDCSGMAHVRSGSWDTAWFLTGNSRWLDKLARRNAPTTRWHELTCNASCGATALITDRAIMRLVSQIEPAS
jgi:hypothetical protein